MQTTNHLLMIRPANFGFNKETAVNNAFQVVNNDDNVAEKALNEFDQFVTILRRNDIDVTVVNDTPEPYTPDSLFPNNWISFHSDGSVYLYPMFAQNRRAERKPAIMQAISRKFQVTNKFDLSGFEASELFLEGTGSMVLDRARSIAYACLSPRTDEAVLVDFCQKAKYKPIAFHATDGNGLDIYHTNVMMCVADTYVVICLESITNPEELKRVTDSIIFSEKTIVPITLKQMNRFAGNMLQVEDKHGEKLLVMSTQAFNSLDEEQVKVLLGFNQIIHSPLDVIETNGGGSARCMMAEIHLPLL